MSAPDIPAALKQPSLVYGILAAACPDWCIAPGRVTAHVERIGFEAAWEAAEAAVAHLHAQRKAFTGREVEGVFDALCRIVVR